MKNIILLSDGTGNSAAKRHKTNVWRLYEALDLHNEDKDDEQIAIYDDGVGSKESTWSKILGGAFGFGLQRNVIDLFVYLCRNYKQDDRIYLFGFSRGAFTVRVLAGLIKYAGVKGLDEFTQDSHPNQQDINAEEELKKWATRIFRKYRHGSKGLRLSSLVYHIWTGIFSKTETEPGTVKPDIECIGVWDTVDAYVFPIDELAVLWSKFIYPIRLSKKNLPGNVLRAYHALSVDDERHTFHPVMWKEPAPEAIEIEQVWFPGVHSDVGGGYPRKSLALVSLDWMISRVEADKIRAGLVFIDDVRKLYHSQSDWNGPQHNSRSGLAVYYRYKPRDIQQICEEEGIGIAMPKIHRSVFERIKGRSVPYGPTGIPENYEMVQTKCGVPHLELEPIKENRKKRINATKPALDTIFWRRCLYYTFLIVTIGLLSARLYLKWDTNGVCKDSACLIDPAMQFIINILPDFLAGSFEALRQNPPILWSYIALYVLIFIGAKKLRNKTQIYATQAWSQLKKGLDPPVWGTSVTENLRIMFDKGLGKIITWTYVSALFLISLYFLAAIINGVLFQLKYRADSLCQKSQTAHPLYANTTATQAFDIADACYATGIYMEKGETYRFSVADTELHDGPFLSDPDGFPNDAPAENPDNYVGKAKIKMSLFVPFRRHIDEPWLKLNGKIDGGGYETFPLGKGMTEYTARGNGELFLYVNDAVFGLGKWDKAYKWERGKNEGTVSIKVKKLAHVNHVN